MTGLSGAALFQSALRAFQANRLGQARTMCEELLRQNRKDVNARDLLGQIALAWGHYDEAEAHLRQCATLRPKEPRAHLVLAQIYSIQGRYREALSRYERVLKLRPKHPDGVAGRADVFEKRGERDKARAALEPFFQAGQATPEMALVRSRVELRDGRLDEALSVIETHLAAAQADTRRQLLIVKGKALEGQGAFDDAFAAWTEANAVLPSPFDPDAWRAHHDQLIEAFNPEHLESWPRASGAGNEAVFIVGMPRSGSTLVEKILDAHPQAHGIGEHAGMQLLVNALPLRIESSLPYPACLEDLDQSDVDRLGRDYLTGARAGAARAERIVDKYLNNYRHLGLISLLLPRARIIYTTRDPLDTCLSCFVEALHPVPHPYASDLAHLGFVHRESERLMAHWRRVLDLSIMEVRYEELVADQPGVSRAIVEFCGLPWDEACLRYYETSRVAPTLSYEQVSRPIYTSSVGRAAQYERHLGPLRAALGLSDQAASS